MIMFGNELWYSSLPVGWSVKKFKYVASLYTGNSIRDSEKDNYTDKRDARPYIATKHIEADNNKIDYENGLYVKYNDTSFRIAKRGSTLMCIEGGSAGKKKGILTQDVSFVNKLCCFEPNFRIDSKYLFYYLMSPNYEEDFKTRITGLIGGVSVSELLNMSIITPPLFEQQAIADYLDETCSKIDEIIAEAKASIDEYKELKQSVIFEAVTKGLNKNVDMKQCSVNWLDEIPSTWESIRLKYLLTEINNRSETGTEQPLSVSQVMGVVPSYMIAVANPTASYVGQKIVEPNDIVFNKLKAHLGVFFMSKYHGLVSPDYAVYRTNDKVIPKYVEYLFHTSACISEFKKYISGVAEGLMRLYTSDLFNIRICLPKVDEQIKIVEYVENKVELFNSLIAEKESLINDLEAYRKSLIYEVVTGKRRVV